MKTRTKETWLDVLQWLFSIGLAGGAWFLLSPGSYWQRLVTVGFCLMAFLLPTGVLWLNERIKAKENG